MKIRRATAKDEDLIKQIHKESKNEIGSFNLFYSWEDYLNKPKNPYVFYVIDGIGFMRYGYSKMMKCFTIKEIGVLNQYKGQGIAKEFFRFVKSPTYLTCNIENDAGNKFYKKMGMKFKGEKLSRNGKQKMNVWVI